ncbi:patatin-like phospholipase family protein [Kitasatospora sp. NPDC090091]|uniref:patatin-like phospholipase family protein n=1 Tax=Kitasatospora sp. NPDC090091 TaxID=3364081 RepID=UPI0037F6F95A
MTTWASQPPPAGAGAAAQWPAQAAHARPAETGAAPTATADATPRCGLVLGGGGMLGAAWTVGALCAVEEATGRRPGDAEVLLGTSAGAILAALLTGGVGADQLRDHQRGLPVTAGPLAGLDFDYDTAVGGALPPRPRVGIGSPGLLRDAVRHPRAHPLLTTVSAMAPHGRGSLAMVGELVRGLHGPGGWSDASPLRVAAVDYRTGHRVVFGDRGAPPAAIADAVMASCAIPGWFTPVRVDGSAYVDGGCWSATNADLMIGRGLDEVFVLAPMALRLQPRERDETGRGTLAALREWHADRDRPRGVLTQLVGGYRRAVTRRLMREAGLLRASGVRVHLLAPTPADLAVMGPNLMDPARRAAVLESSLHTSRAALDGVR